MDCMDPDFLCLKKVNKLTHSLIFLFFLQEPEPFQYLEKFNFAMKQYLQALGGIVPIFNYMVSS